jgi:hypothetical protein
VVSSDHVLPLSRQALDKLDARPLEVSVLWAVRLASLAGDSRTAVRQREAEERRRSQAAGVAAWLAMDQRPVSGVPMLAAVLSNQSDRPVYEAQVFLHYMEEHRPGIQWTPTADGASQVIKILVPCSGLHVGLSQYAAPQPEEDDGRAYAVSIIFTDAAGNRWERDPSGAVKPTPPDSAYLMGASQRTSEQPPSAPLNV